MTRDFAFFLQHTSSPRCLLSTPFIPPLTSSISRYVLLVFFVFYCCPAALSFTPLGLCNNSNSNSNNFYFKIQQNWTKIVKRWRRKCFVATFFQCMFACVCSQRITQEKKTAKQTVRETEAATKTTARGAARQRVRTGHRTRNTAAAEATTNRLQQVRNTLQCDRWEESCSVLLGILHNWNAALSKSFINRFHHLRLHHQLKWARKL